MGCWKSLTLRVKIWTCNLAHPLTRFWFVAVTLFVLLPRFYSKFVKFRENISRLDRFFMRKDQMNAQSWDGDGGRKRQGDAWGGDFKRHKGASKGIKGKQGKGSWT
ncbi:unnamed protein product [Effrenium voratum]|nr:unnamed protein product [Effrenium voratum]